MKRIPCLAVATAILLTSLTLHGQPPVAPSGAKRSGASPDEILSKDRRDAQIRIGNDSDTSPHGSRDDWGLKLAPVPRLLQIHCSDLSDGSGLVIEQVEADSAASRFGLQEHDVLWRVDGRSIRHAEQLPSPHQTEMLWVLRRGRIEPLRGGGTAVSNALPQSLPAVRMPPAFGWQSPANRMPRRNASTAFATAKGAAVSASSYSDGRHSVSISQAGDRVVVEVSGSDVGRKPIRLEGTRAEVRVALPNSGLSPAVQAEVVQAIGDSR